MTNLRIVALTYKTFPAALPVVQEVATDVLKRMGMRVTPIALPDDAGAAGILASAWQRQFHVELESTGVARTRARILAKDGVLLEENTAADFIGQVMRQLEAVPHGAAKAPDASAPLPVAVAG